MIILVSYLIMTLATSGLIMHEFGGRPDVVHALCALLLAIMWPVILPLMLAVRYYERKSDG